MPDRQWQVAVGTLNDADRAQVLALAAAAAEFDGVAPLSEVPLLRLSETAPWLTHILIRHARHSATSPLTPRHSGSHSIASAIERQRSLPSAQSPEAASPLCPRHSAASPQGAERRIQSAETAILGYAQVDRSGETASAELVVHPAFRRQGIGSQLLAVAEADARMPAHAGAGASSGKELRVWAHGDTTAAQSFAQAKGYQPVRELLLLSRPNTSLQPGTVLPTRQLPVGYQVRPFQPEHDGPDWVSLNALVFKDHPEQGRLTLSDLHARQQEAWFNPGDFYVIVQQDTQTAEPQMVAFCWVKVVGDAGEIYAIGVHPEHRRRKLADYLMQNAFTQLAAAGQQNTTLYVEGDNEAALAAYYTAGFKPVTADIQYAKSPT